MVSQRMAKRMRVLQITSKGLDEKKNAQPSNNERHRRYRKKKRQTMKWVWFWYIASIASSQRGDLRLSKPSSGQGAGDEARTRDGEVIADLKANSLSTMPPTPHSELG
ncbi:hypothetical protein PoB_001734200 [Plakobranchus ocellatus]|uniref:Uncharacterized protein n=1 Tax=Plakobranchus ocellatus TaxID=259542 RepID=A0AAV3Z8N6_9GAST|nr:hypothetical protein PoB_001734200 [Plakobranchus ocellatus]